MGDNTLESGIPQDNYRKKRVINQSDQERSEKQYYLPESRRYLKGIDLAAYIGKEIPEWVVNEVLSDLAGE